MEVKSEIVYAILALFGIGLIGVIQTLKRILKVQGVGALALAFAVSALSTAFYLFTTNSFSIISWVVYTFIVFGEASGLYHVIKKP